MRLVWLSIDAPNKNIGQGAVTVLETCLSFLPLKKYSSSVSLPVSFSNSNSFCFIWSLMKYKSMISITFWINLILFKISANQKNQMKKKIFVWCDFKKVTFELKLYFARPFATQRFYNCKIHSDSFRKLQARCWWRMMKTTVTLTWSSK